MQDNNTEAITSVEVQESLPAKKQTPKKITTLSQSKPLKIQDSKKEEESESNSDDFPEEEEYEKISSRIIEKEFSPNERKKNKSDLNLSSKSDEIINELRQRNKKVVEIGSGDS